MPSATKLSLAPPLPFRQPAAPVLTPAHYREALHLADSLANLADPRRSAAASPEQVLNVQTSQVCMRDSFRGDCCTYFSSRPFFAQYSDTAPFLSNAWRIRTKLGSFSAVAQRM